MGQVSTPRKSGLMATGHAMTPAVIIPAMVVEVEIPPMAIDSSGERENPPPILGGGFLSYSYHPGLFRIRTGLIVIFFFTPKGGVDKIPR